jgi:pimeloyl-ACP methyl ester carboxylesterase
MDMRQQFRVLYREFLRRMVDLELLSARGDLNNLLVQFAGLLAAFSLVLTIYLVPPAAFSTLPREVLARAAWGTQEFLISTTIAVVGMFTVVSWDALLPSRMDSLVLGMLPVRTRTIFRAKIAAIASALCASVIAVNSFTGMVMPYVALPAGPEWLVGPRAFFAYWITMTAAGVFVFCALLATQGIAAQLLPYPLFLRVSGFLQVAAFFLVLAVYFLTPGSSELQLNSQESQRLIRWLPSFWFLALFQKLNGVAEPTFQALVSRAVWGFCIATGVAAVTYTLSYWRILRLIIEQPDIVPSDRKHGASFLLALISRTLKTPLERAILLFTARTIGRSRQHRNILAAFTGMGLAISLTFARSMLYGDTQMYAIARRYGFRAPRWDEPNVALLAGGFVMLILAVIGIRAVFSLPIHLNANWIFRVTDVHSPAAYFKAVRKSVFLLGATPVWMAAAVLYLTIWPRVPALAHLVVLMLVASIVTETALREFRKVPFACSYLPGKSDMRLKLGSYGIGFFFATYVGAAIEQNFLETIGRMVVVYAVLIGFAIRARGRWLAFAQSPVEQLQFEDLEIPEVSPLNLSDAGAYGRMGQRYLDVLDAPLELPLRQRAKAFAKKAAVVTLVAAGVGAVYEQVGEWRDRDRFPIVGQRVDIGGRSLNIFCSGEGSPAVVFESGSGSPGYRWVFVQREVAKFTRACWYDRAGYGWSDPAPYPRDSLATSHDLHRLLQAAGVAGPYVLVGHSLGGFHVRVFNRLYPADVAGVVFVDSSYEYETNAIPTHTVVNLPPAIFRFSVWMAQIVYRVGLARLLTDAPRMQAIPKGFSSQDWIAAHAYQERSAAESAKEIYVQCKEEAMAAGGFGDRPLIVLTAGLSSNVGTSPVEERRILAEQSIWLEIQANLARLSTRGKQVVVHDARHAIHYDRPDVVIGAVREVVEEVRGRAHAL